jgi:hypothetical protein
MASDPNLSDLKLYYSGGGSNAVTTLSIGGAISSARVLSQTATGLTTLTGVTIDDALGNGIGAGTLTYTASTTSLTWQPYGGSVGTAVVVNANGSYFIQGASNGGGLCITVVVASLPTSNVSNTITVANQTQKLFLNQTKAESNAGVTKYHCFAIKNAHATLDMIEVKLWIAENTPGADTNALYLDPLAAGTGGTGPTAVATENTAPAASTFVTPDSATHADVLSVGTLTAGQCRFFWVRQLTPAGVTTATTSNTFKIGVSMRA